MTWPPRHEWRWFVGLVLRTLFGFAVVFGFAVTWLVFLTAAAQ